MKFIVDKNHFKKLPHLVNPRFFEVAKETAEEIEAAGVPIQTAEALPVQMGGVFITFKPKQKYKYAEIVRHYDDYHTVRLSKTKTLKNYKALTSVPKKSVGITIKGALED